MTQDQPSANALAALLMDTGTLGVELAIDSANPSLLRYRPATLPLGLAARLRLHKAFVLAILRGDLVFGATSNARYVILERLGIADELRMPTHLGSPAWLVAVGEGLNSSCHMTNGVID